jgi:hypothetical protein
VQRLLQPHVPAEAPLEETMAPKVKALARMAAATTMTMMTAA